MENIHKNRMKIVLFGAGENAKRFLRYSPVAKWLEIVGVVDNNAAKWGDKFEQVYTVESPNVISSREWNRIVVTPYTFHQIKEQLVQEYGIHSDKILNFMDLIVPADSNLGSVRLDCDYNRCYEIGELVPDKILPQNRLEEFYFKHSHRIVSKWWHYFDIYHTFFQKYIGSDVKILEIGVCKGGSLQMWKDYFGKQAIIVGIDIEENCKAFEEENVHVCIGSQGDSDFLSQVEAEWGPFDIVLDDGSHMMDHQIITFETLFPRLNDGGVYICEDCHSSYSARYGGGYRQSGTFIEYSKNFVDYVNSQFVNLEEKKNIPAVAEIVKACHYYDSMVVVEKKQRGYSFSTESSC